MQIWQNYFLIFLLFYSLIAVFNGYNKCKEKKEAFEVTNLFIPLGAWVWGDVLVFGIFWFIVSATFLFILKNWYLFLLVTSIYWTVRSFGEINYWLNQQFSVIKKNPPKNLLFHNIFYNDSIWFIYQTVWQCVAVLFIISSIYFSYIWLTNL